jgi:hypothetical protein
MAHTWLHAISLAILMFRVRWPFSGLTPGATWHSSNTFCFVSLWHLLTLIIPHCLSLSPFPLPAFLPYSLIYISLHTCIPLKYVEKSCSWIRKIIEYFYESPRKLKLII